MELDEGTAGATVPCRSFALIRSIDNGGCRLIAAVPEHGTVALLSGHYSNVTGPAFRRRSESSPNHPHPLSLHDPQKGTQNQKGKEYCRTIDRKTHAA
jgi:hypothetical protein